MKTITMLDFIDNPVECVESINRYEDWLLSELLRQQEIEKQKQKEKRKLSKAKTLYNKTMKRLYPHSITINGNTTFV